MSALCFNPFISITPSKPLLSSGSWLTLHNYEIFYLLAINYDPATTDLIFIRVNIYPGPGEGNSQLLSQLFQFIRVTIYPVALPHNISRSCYLPSGVGVGAYRLIFLTIYFSRSHYLPCNTYCLGLACIKATIHIRPLRFFHDLANI
jgi:hypothetical protein